jgi:hypothetical protein
MTSHPPESIGSARETYARPNLVRHPLARALSVLRGDKYMADAYPPAPTEH